LYLKGVIVGLDLGTTVGIAVLDIKGNLVSVFSKKDFGKNEIVKYITKYGKPLIVASDVSPASKKVGKIASSVGGKVFYPEQSMSITEKNEITREFEKKFKNDHERYALAAGIKALKKYGELINKTNFTLQQFGISHRFEEVITLLLREESNNINDAIDKILAIKKRKSFKK